MRPLRQATFLTSPEGKLIDVVGGSGLVDDPTAGSRCDRLALTSDCGMRHGLDYSLLESSTHLEMVLGRRVHGTR